VVVCCEQVASHIHLNRLNFKYQNRIFLLVGELLSDADLTRAAVFDAEAIFLFTDHKHANTHVMDSKTILQCLSVRIFCDREALEEREANAERKGEQGEAFDDETTEGPSLHIQLRQERDHDEERNLKDVVRYEQVVHTSSLKSAILARNCVYPGTATLLFNLVRSYDEDEMRLMGASPTWAVDPAIDNGAASSPEANRTWQDEYLSGTVIVVSTVLY
jgi:hypothetical protein